MSAFIKATANMSSESRVVSKMTTNNLVKQNVCKVANSVIKCHQSWLQINRLIY